jgi:hypothetical protein
MPRCQWVLREQSPGACCGWRESKGQGSPKALGGVAGWSAVEKSLGMGWRLGRI